MRCEHGQTMGTCKLGCKQSTVPCASFYWERNGTEWATIVERRDEATTDEEWAVALDYMANYVAGLYEQEEADEAAEAIFADQSIKG